MSSTLDEIANATRPVAKPHLVLTCMSKSLSSAGSLLGQPKALGADPLLDTALHAETISTPGNLKTSFV